MKPLHRALLATASFAILTASCADSSVAAHSPWNKVDLNFWTDKDYGKHMMQFGPGSDPKSWAGNGKTVEWLQARVSRKLVGKVTEDLPHQNQTSSFQLPAGITITVHSAKGGLGKSKAFVGPMEVPDMSVYPLEDGSWNDHACSVTIELTNP